MAFLNGTLQLMEPSEPRGHRLPIDFLFRSLAQDQHERAIGIVLSGTGSDGTLGVRSIKSEGGMVMAQNPVSCEFDGMPNSAIQTGLVDYTLPPAEMPQQLISYVAHAFGRPPRTATSAHSQPDSTLKKIFVLLRSQTGHDFSQYKPSTIHRRIERRMAVHQVDAMEGYVKYLQQTPAEVEALFHDLLIGVTSFFRDPDAFAVLESEVIPKALEGKPLGSVVRVWTTGCSSGEEAYSIAILMQERLEAIKQTYKVQVFATDIDSRSIALARAGVYPISISQDISPERLARFFTPEPGGSSYRVSKTIRDMLVFSEQNVIKDPPFSKLDLISCRNLLIYLGADLQRKLISLFHYALNPAGMLFLGTSETVGEFSDMFVPVDRKAKLYRRKDDSHSKPSLVIGGFSPSVVVKTLGEPVATAKPRGDAKQSLRGITEQTLLQNVFPVAVLVNAQGEILFFRGRTGRYLEPTPGEVGVSNILKMARDGLRRELAQCLHKAAHTRLPAEMAGLQVKTNGHFSKVNLTVYPADYAPVDSQESALFVVVLDETAVSQGDDSPEIASRPVAGGSMTPDVMAQIAELKAELRNKEEFLNAANEALETSNEDLKSSNEEMQSVNEELQSTNEELETSKEELQSINEELSTVNAELQTKVGDLSRANNDMNNLLAGTGIGTIFVDHNLRILRFTPAATQIINLIQSDLGRPVGHIMSNLVDYDQMIPDAQSVLKTLTPKEVDVQTREGKSFTLRILPYRTLDNVIEGLVITFVDITEVVRTREALRKAQELVQTKDAGTNHD